MKFLPIKLKRISFGKLQLKIIQEIHIDFQFICEKLLKYD